MTALTLYPLNAQATTTLSTASNCASTTGGSQVDEASEYDTSTGYGQLYPLGHSGSGLWAGSGSIGNPDGHGWLWDSINLEGNQTIAGNWTPTITLNSDTSLTGTIYFRAYKRSSGGTYTSINTWSLASQTINGFTNTVYNFSAANLAAVNFNTGDKLYFDTWVNITANGSGFSGAQMYIHGSSATTGTTDVQVVTPGYQAQPKVATSIIVSDSMRAGWASGGVS